MTENQQGPNSQYNFAPPASLSVRIAARVRRRMFKRFMHNFAPDERDDVLDIGVTSDRTYESSNYFEALYPFKERLVAAGLDDASFLEQVYPGVKFVFANALNLPFRDGSFGFVHCAAVWEHVGNVERQAAMLAECLRVARRGVCLTTPNRWFPIEVHTQIPLLHWLPKHLHRAFLARTKFRALAQESHLNLMTGREVRDLAKHHPAWSFKLEYETVLGWPSNILCFAKKRRNDRGGGVA